MAARGVYNNGSANPIQAREATQEAIRQWQRAYSNSSQKTFAFATRVADYNVPPGRRYATPHLPCKDNDEMNPLGDSVTESAKAVREVAKTTSEALEAAREAGGFISRFIAGPLEQGIGIFEDKLRYVRWERQQRFMQKALQVQQELGLLAPNRAVPLREV